MSETFTMNYEHHELEPGAEHIEVKRLPDAAHAEKLREGEKDPLQALAEAQSAVAEVVHEDASQALVENLKAAEAVSAAPTTPQSISRDLRNITVKRELKGLQRQESLPQRTLSKVVHQPAIRAVSEVAGGTVSRPSGLLGGGIVAFFGTSSYLYLAKHLGFEYNFMVFLILFAGGFAFGLLLELLVHIATMSRRKAIEL